MEATHLWKMESKAQNPDGIIESTAVEKVEDNNFETAIRRLIEDIYVIKREIYSDGKMESVCVSFLFITGYTKYLFSQKFALNVTSKWLFCFCYHYHIKRADKLLLSFLMRGLSDLHLRIKFADALWLIV